MKERANVFKKKDLILKRTQNREDKLLAEGKLLTVTFLHGIY